MQTRIANFVLAILCMSYATQAQTVLLSEDFEGGTLGAFSAGVPVGTINWNNTQIRGGNPGHSATRSAYFGNTADTTYDTGLIEGGDLTFMACDVTGKQVMVTKLGREKRIVSLASLSTGLYVYGIFATAVVAVAQGKFNVLK